MTIDTLILYHFVTLTLSIENRSQRREEAESCVEEPMYKSSEINI
jgi:hypothetical protein